MRIRECVVQSLKTIRGVYMTFVDWLRDQMHQRHINQSALAKLIGVNPSTVSNWLRETSRPDTESLAILARVFDYDHLALMEIAGVITERDPELPTGDELMLIDSLKVLRGTPVYKPTLHTLQTIAELAITLLDPPPAEENEDDERGNSG